MTATAAGGSNGAVDMATTAGPRRGARAGTNEYEALLTLQPLLLRLWL